MNYYYNKINRIKNSHFANQWQIDKVIAIKNYIDHHFNTALHLELLSDVHFTSKYHLLRLFRKYYGLTPRQYLIDVRIHKSKEFLMQGMTITEACFAVGFESLGSFSTLFKSKTGKSPTKFQKEQLSRSN